MQIKPVMRWDSTQRKLRLFRLMWRRGIVGDGKGYSAKAAVSVTPRLFGFVRDFDGWRLTLLGVQVHHVKSWGGIFV